MEGPGPRTPFSDLLGLEHPLALAPMGGVAGGKLAAAVSNAGALGLVGAGRRPWAWIEHEMRMAADSTDRPWGVGFLSWATPVEMLEAALAFNPRVVMLSFGRAGALAGTTRRAGVILMMQVTDMAEARDALSMGADVVVAQGYEAGGHGGRRGTLGFVPAVVDLAGRVPVLAAGGIADGRGVAAALALGAAGALVGTRLEASEESLAAPTVKAALVSGRGDDTIRSRAFDVLRDPAWPERYTGRALRNAFFDRWQSRQGDPERDEAARTAFRAAEERQGPTEVPVWASQALDLVGDIRPAGEIVRTMSAEAGRTLIRAAAAVAAAGEVRPAPGRPCP